MSVEKAKPDTKGHIEKTLPPEKQGRANHGRTREGRERTKGREKGMGEAVSRRVRSGRGSGKLEQGGGEGGGRGETSKVNDGWRTVRNESFT